MAWRPDIEGRAMLDRLTRLRMDAAVSMSSDEDSDGELDLMTLIHNKCGDGVYDPAGRNSNLDGFQYARNRGRRKSKEFEDLLLHTATGKLRMSRQHISLRPRTSSTSSSKPPFLPLPSPSTARKVSGSGKTPQVTKPKRTLRRSSSDLADRITPLKPMKSTEGKSHDSVTGSKGHGQSPTRATPGSPNNKRNLKDKHSKNSHASPKLSPSKHQAL